MQTIETERLIMNPVEIYDAPFILELFNTPSWLKHIGDRNVHTLQQATAYIQTKMIEHIKKKGYGNYILVTKDSNKKIGICGLIDRDGLDEIEIGYALLPKYQRNGYALEAAKATLNFAKHALNLAELKAITTLDNSASQQLLLKIGFSNVGTTKIPPDTKDFLLFKKKL